MYEVNGHAAATPVDPGPAKLDPLGLISPRRCDCPVWTPTGCGQASATLSWPRPAPIVPNLSKLKRLQIKPAHSCRRAGHCPSGECICEMPPARPAQGALSTMRSELAAELQRTMAPPAAA